MKLSGLKVDSARAERGAWVGNIPDCGDLRLRVRGPMNADARRLRAKLIGAIPRDQRNNGRPDPTVIDEITGQVMVETILIDWEGLTDDEGATIPFSVDRAKELLLNPDMRPLRDAVSWASETVGEDVATSNEADAKN